MKKLNLMLRKCKTLSRQLVRTSSYTSLRSKSTRESTAAPGGIMWNTSAVVVYGCKDEPKETVFVGSTRKRYVIDSKYLSHPLVNALIEKSNDVSVVNCEVVLFDHLLWMLENNSELNLSSDALDELAGLYSS
ncbi:auxin-responsive protein SAUR78-like [Bidens hawaiensis]|uniref:auxin-responsive protein SAUR78-like n=1 Tax=Bidens hawaiensis TaxID=980011 RepID=UPI004049D9DE